MLTGLGGGDRFAVYTYIKSLCCTPETNTELYVNYISVNLEKNQVLKTKTKQHHIFFGGRSEATALVAAHL